MLIIVKKNKPKKTDKENRYIGFVTNCHDYSGEDLLSLPEEYRKRGVQRQDAKSVMPRTASLNATIRIAPFHLSLIITNIWQFARSKHAGIELKLLMGYVIGPDAFCTLPKKPPDPG